MRLLPSQVIAGIRELASGAPSCLGGVWPDDGAPKIDGTLSDVQLESIARIAAFIDALPQDILDICPNPMPIIVARASIQNFLNQPPARVGFEGRKLPGKVIVDLYEAVRKLPDRVVPPAVSNLSFIQDEGLREMIRMDLASVETSMRDADWKAATVMAGSAAEALLMWAILNKKSTTGKPMPANAEELRLADLIYNAKAMGLIKDDPTADMLRKMKDFRDLIHPGKTKREKVSCSRATAVGALSAVLHLIQEIE